MPVTNTWPLVRFGDVVRNVKVDVKPEESGLERYVAGEHMDTDDLHIRRWGIIGDGYLGPAFHRKFLKGQVLYGSRRTYLRKVAVAEFDGICANTTFVLEPSSDELLPELLPFIMQTEAFTEHSVKQSKGSVNPYINWKDIAWYEFALPPKDEQRRIAEILWAADKAIESHRQALSLLSDLKERVRQSVYFNTINGERMTVNLQEIADIRYGLGQPPNQTESGTPMIRATDIKRGRIIGKDILKVDLNDVSSNRAVFLQPGDIIVVRSGAYTGDSAIVTSKWAGALAGYDLVISPRRSQINPTYLAEFLLCSRVIEGVLKPMSVRTAQPHLNAQEVGSIEILLLPLDQQHQWANAFEEFDKSIIYQEKHLVALDLLKKGLLSSLLT